ncbi:MAG: XylR family transcriptional regulator, partial [Phycisphaerales bacterium]|nr:XylR family transcriptional regulator [Phycisphaerales bacterium]
MDKAQIGNSDLISTVNSRLILQAVRMMQPTYRAAVARQTGLKPATVTGIVNDLLSQQILSEVPAATPTGSDE